MLEKKLKKLPLGISTFSEIIQENYVYVDKTKHIYNMIMGGKYYFLSRPRRFGKSLLVSTLEDFFSGNKKLFDNLWIGKSDYDWPEHPVIRFDFSSIGHRITNDLIININVRLDNIARDYNLDVAKCPSIDSKFQEIIIQLSKINKVVILIDEYDKPILDHIDNPAEAKAQREVLKNLYSVIKGSDKYIKFVFFTGVSKFAKASVFSGINNLSDISLDKRYAEMLGYTSLEFTDNFLPYIERLAETYKKDVVEIVKDLTNYYDGYQFSENSDRMFNPYSVMRCLDAQKFESYWFASGTPEFLLHIIKNKPYDLGEIESPVLDATHLDKIDVERISLTALLFQTGYLTITNFNSKTGKFTLNFPNREVRNAFIIHLTDVFVDLPPERTINYAREIAFALCNSDMKSAQDLLQDLFNKMPYTNHIRHERDLHFILYCIFKLIGIEVDPEVVTSIGRADLVVSFKKLIYVIELKFNKSAKEALEQIQDKKYYEKFLNTDKQITLVGINFESETKTVSLESQGV